MDLYQRQADFEAFEHWLRDNVPASQLCRLEYSDLLSSGGAIWTSTLSDFTGVDLGAPKASVVNAGKLSPSLAKRMFILLVRLVQKTRLHIGVKRLLMRDRFRRIPMHQLDR
jgi:hypothetical protein